MSAPAFAISTTLPIPHVPSKLPQSGRRSGRCDFHEGSETGALSEQHDDEAKAEGVQHRDGKPQGLRRKKEKIKERTPNEIAENMKYIHENQKRVSKFSVFMQSRQ